MELLNNIKDTIKEAATEAKQEFIDRMTTEETDEEGRKGVNPKVVAGAIIVGAGLGYFAWNHYDIGGKIQAHIIKRITEKLDELDYDVVKRTETEVPTETPTEENK